MQVGSFVRPDYENQHQFHACDDNHKYRGKKISTYVHLRRTMNLVGDFPQQA